MKGIQNNKLNETANQNRATLDGDWLVTQNRAEPSRERQSEPMGGVEMLERSLHGETSRSAIWNSVYSICLDTFSWKPFGKEYSCLKVF